MELQIKRFSDLTVGELYGILSLRNAIFIVEQHCAYQDIDGLDPYGYHFFYKGAGGKIIACLRVLDKGRKFPGITVGRVVVSPAYRSQGLAKKLLTAALAFLRENETEKDIRISAQARLEKFYNQVGFVKCSEVYDEDGIPHMNMKITGN